MSNAQVTFQNEKRDPAKPGEEFYFSFVCPNRRHCDLLQIRKGKGQTPKPSWEWDGNVESPTFGPSINHQGCWHGYIRQGRCFDTQGNEEPEPEKEGEKT